VIVPDVNLVLYANFTAYAQHADARSWWVATLNDTERVGISTATLFGFLRMSTNRRIFASPLSVDESISRVESWLARPQVDLLQPGPRHLEIALGLLRKLGTAANLTTDVQLAALAIENQAELYSNDSDFARFPGLRWVDPLAKR